VKIDKQSEAMWLVTSSRRPIEAAPCGLQQSKKAVVGRLHAASKVKDHEVLLDGPARRDAR